MQSSLGEALRAEIDVTALTPEEASSLKVHIAPPDAYRAAGVDYNAALASASVTLQRRADGRPYLRVMGDRPVGEPFVDVILELNWSSGRLVREFTMLFDPPATRAAAPASAPTVISPAPSSSTAAAPLPPRAAAPSPSPAAAPAPAPAPRPAAAPALRAAAEPSASAATEYRVKAGDTLYRIASRTQQPGVSLDQMLVSLYRSNPDAFLGNNMNRLKAGAVLTVPSADQGKAVSPSDARQVIQAQSADFGAYREKLAGGVPTTVAQDSSRSAAGKVQAEVQDRKTASGGAPDKLTLSKGAVGASKPGPEDQLAKGREQKDSSTRVAELSKNVEELKKLQGAAAAGSAASAGAAKPGALAVPAPTVVPPAPKPAPVPTPTPPAPAPAPAPVPSPAPAASAEAPAVVASAPATVAEPPVAAPSSPAPAAAASEPAVAPAPTPTQGPSFIDGLLENPLLLPGAGVLVALLAGFGFYRMRQGKRDSGETSFLESRLQPDSFFGASGGQRVDTRDATGVPSSMSYSLSQLDAIGDVDPVAEADVYLAYGRDLQAEEILKEAMRSSPERMAIRLKLLEVYAKRRDTKGFELLATQLYALTGGEGEDWTRAQQLGVGIDPENPMYQPGGRPPGVSADGGAVVEALGASTMPQSVLPSPSRFDAQRSEILEDPGVDLDLDVSVPGALDETPRSMPERTQPLPTAAAGDLGFDFELPSLSLDAPSDPAATPGVEQALPDLGNFDLPGDVATDEALARKLELAEEFRQIGDLEGARDLLQEVVARSSGTLKTKAQSMLKDIG
ncbi:FimV/HubP family polar landmark protein [Methylibium sp.]|uniref:FimV/HubP family polar landmark protein n=1 Tax=Methylibium sp. TaxID=2067992 RepID=UPI003D0E166D